MRSLALDVHRDFCEVAIKGGGEVRSAGRIKASGEELEPFARSLGAEDRVAPEASGPALRIARVLEPHVGRVVIANTRRVRAIAEAKVKTDRVDARTLCELLAAGFLPEVFGPDDATRALRRRLARRAALVRQRTRAKNEVHAVPARNLGGRPPMRRRVRGDPAADERAGGEPRLGGDLLGHGRRHRPLGDAPKARLLRRTRSQGAPIGRGGRHGHISKQGSATARHMLCEAAWIVVRTPGPLRAFYERLRARRGAQIALVATARKLCVLFWHLLTNEQDYAFGRPSFTATGCADSS
jgi:transposase